MAEPQTRVESHIVGWRSNNLSNRRSLGGAPIGLNQQVFHSVPAGTLLTLFLGSQSQIVVCFDPRGSYSFAFQSLNEVGILPGEALGRKAARMFLQEHFSSSFITRFANGDRTWFDGELIRRIIECALPHARKF